MRAPTVREQETINKMAGLAVKEGMKKNSERSVENGDYIISNGLWHVLRHIGNGTNENDRSKKRNRATRCMLMGQLMRFRCVDAIMRSDFSFLALSFSVFVLADHDTMTWKLEYI